MTNDPIDWDRQSEDDLAQMGYYDTDSDGRLRDPGAQTFQRFVLFVKRISMN